MTIIVHKVVNNSVFPSFSEDSPRGTNDAKLVSPFFFPARRLFIHITAIVSPPRSDKSKILRRKGETPEKVAYSIHLRLFMELLNIKAGEISDSVHYPT